MKFLPLSKIDLDIAISANQTLELQVISMLAHLLHSGNSSHLSPMISGIKEIRGYKSKVKRVEDTFLTFEVSSKLSNEAKASLKELRTKYGIDPRTPLDEHPEDVQSKLYSAIEEALFTTPQQPKKNQLDKIQAMLDKGFNGEATDADISAFKQLQKAVDDANKLGLWLDPSKGMLKEMPIKASDDNADDTDNTQADADADAQAKVVESWTDSINMTTNQAVTAVLEADSLEEFYDKLTAGEIALPKNQVDSLIKKIEATMV